MNRMTKILNKRNVGDVVALCHPHLYYKCIGLIIRTLNVDRSSYEVLVENEVAYYNDYELWDHDDPDIKIQMTDIERDLNAFHNLEFDLTPKEKHNVI